MNNIEYYLSLPYKVEVIEQNNEFIVSIPLLGKAFTTDGSTLEEALKNLHCVKRSMFKLYLKKNIPILEPIDSKAFKGIDVITGENYHITINKDNEKIVIYDILKVIKNRLNDTKINSLVDKIIKELS